MRSIVTKYGLSRRRRRDDMPPSMAVYGCHLCTFPIRDGGPPFPFPPSGLTTTILSRIFRIKVNFTAFRTTSGIFESTSGFRLLLPVHRFRFVASVFLIGSISSRLSAIRQPYGPEYGKRRPRAIEVKPEVEIWRQPVFLTQRPRIPI